MTQERKELTFDPHAGEFEAFLYSPSNKFLGIVRNEVTMLAFLCKVCAIREEGYYVIYNGKKYLISENGRTDLPINFLDEYLEFLLGF